MLAAGRSWLYASFSAPQGRERSQEQREPPGALGLGLVAGQQKSILLNKPRCGVM